jgi:tail lysozyme
MKLTNHHLSVGVAALFALVACGSPPPPEVSQTSSALGGSPNQTACDYFVGKGLTDVQAAGIVGNLDQESSMNPTVSQYGGGPGRGIAQWSAGGRWDTDHDDNVVWYASEHGESPYSLSLQLDFIWYELETFPGYGLSALRHATNITDATVAFETDFEACGECDQSQRVAYAEDALSSCGPPLPPAPAPPTTCGTLTAGQGLGQGASVRSCNGAYELIMQSDGNLVLYEGTKALWATMTNGKGGFRLDMQSDGNLVVYTSSRAPLWATNTSGHSGAHFAVQDDSNIVIYDGTTPLWARFGL